jgi:putative iron-regulated protein
MRTTALVSSLLAGVALCAGALPAAAVEAADVLDTYADMALAEYQDSLAAAEALREAIGALVATPSDATMTSAKEAWLAARAPYQQTEAYRFGNAAVDEWEGKVNAWPLDEGLIDYVDAGYGTESDANDFYTVNVVANAQVSAGGETIDASTINPELIQSLHEVGGIESNVATGYHAIEFLLWGQDLNGTDAGAGARPYTDFSTSGCTGGHCDRRAAYLTAAADLLVTDLRDIVGQWEEGGAARAALTAESPEAGITAILTGLGSLSYGELAGERMKLGLLLNDPEEEHDCFSDNTHNSHYYDMVGIANVWKGSYTRTDGSTVDGASLADFVREKDAAIADEMDAKIEASLAAFTALKQRADTTEAYDQMIGEGNAEGNAVVQAAIDGLVDQTRSIERVIASLDLDGVTIEGSDSLDNPDAVFE